MKNRLFKMLDKHFLKYYHFGVDSGISKDVAFFTSARTEYDLSVEWAYSLGNSTSIIDILQYLQTIKTREEHYANMVFWGHSSIANAQLQGARQGALQLKRDFEDLVQNFYKECGVDFRDIVVFKC